METHPAAGPGTVVPPFAFMAKRLRVVAVVGTGAFGRGIHLRVLRELEGESPAGGAFGGVTLAAAVEPEDARAAEVAEAYDIPVFADVEALLEADLGLDAASVAVPTVHHHAVASLLLANGVDCLVEKPLAASVDEADELLDLAERHKRILQAGASGAIQSGSAGD